MGATARRRRRRKAALAGLLAAGALYLLPGWIGDVHAEVTNNGLNCTGTIAGVSAAGVDSENVDQAIKVGENQNVVVTATSDQPIRYFIDLAFSFRGWEVASGDSYTTSYSTTVKVSDYDRFGTGLYRVTVHNNGLHGSCDMAALVDVTKDAVPGTIAGDAGLVLGLLGLGGVGGSVLRANSGGTDSGGDGGGGGGGDTPPREVPTPLLPPDDDWCWDWALPAMLLTLGMMAVPGGRGGAPAAPAQRLPRARWRPRISVFGIISGLLGTLGVLILLQQTGKVFPTLRVVITAFVVGLVVSIALPSLVRIIPVVRWNSRMAARERAMAMRPAAPAAPAAPLAPPAAPAAPAAPPPAPPAAEAPLPETPPAPPTAPS